jgi:CheY-like chemotaxis protein
MVAQVVDDGNAGLNAAAAEKPDLILLSIELPRMNGFSVCNKLKKDPGLKDVPLIIMSSDSSDETFEQHRKLRTRAEGYVHKPIAFGELLEYMRPYVPFDNGRTMESLGDDTGIIIDDDIEIEDVEQSNGALDEDDGDDETARIDREVQAFADTAFDRLLEEPTSSREPSAPPPAVVKEVKEEVDEVAALPHLAPASVAPAPPPADDTELQVLRNDLEQYQVDNARLARELGEARSEVERLEQAALDDSGSKEQVERLQRELDEVRLKAASGGKIGGVSSREFLDLREALNKKDKEILGLRDQITRKEKELLDASDAALVLERDKADQDDKIGQLEKEVHTAKALVDSLRADKDQAAKRAEDFKVRAEKLKVELEARQTELAGIQKRHEEEFAEREAEFLAATQQYREEREREALAHKSALDSAAHEAEEKLARTLEQLQKDEQHARDEALGKAKEEADAARAAALAAREAELVAAHEGRISALAAERDQRVTELTAELDRETSRLTAELERETAKLVAELDRAKQDADSTRERLLAREKELEEQRLNELGSKEAELTTRFAGERQELEIQTANARSELEAKHATQIRELETKHETIVMELSGKYESEKASFQSQYRSEKSDFEAARERERKELEGRIADLFADLSARTEERETLAREVAMLRDRIPPLESDLSDTKGELGRLRDILNEQQRRNEAMLSRWNLNRTSLEQAKDAIAAAVAQIEEAEVRGLE